MSRDLKVLDVSLSTSQIFIQGKGNALPPQRPQALFHLQGRKGGLHISEGADTDTETDKMTAHVETPTARCQTTSTSHEDATPNL